MRFFALLSFLLFFNSSLFSAVTSAVFECPPLAVYTNEVNGSRFGRSVVSASDVNNDGYADLIVGAPLNDAGGPNAGRAYVFSGQNGDTLFVFTGELPGDELGVSVVSAGDVNNDGFTDLIVGAPWNDIGGGNSD